MIEIRGRRRATNKRAVRREHGWVLWAALSMIAAQLIFRGWGLAGGWYRVDDFVWYSKIHLDGVDAKLIFSPYAAHLMPAGWLATWANWELGGLSFTLPMIELLALTALANIGALVFLISAFGRRPGILVPLAVFLFAVITVPATQWWAAGINQIPTLATFMWGAWAHLNYLRGRKLRWAVITMVITLIGLAFAEKTVLVFVIYAVLALGYFATGDIMNRIREVFRTYRVGTIMYAVVAVGYLGVYIVSALSFDPSQSNDQSLGPIVWNMAARAFGTGLVGGPLRWNFSYDVGGVANPGDLVTLVALVVIAAVVYELIKTRTNTKRAWLVVGIVLASDIVLVAAGRAVFVGPVIGLEYRYITETAAAAAISIGLASMPLRGATETVGEVRSSAFFNQPWRVATATLVVAALGAYSSWLYLDNWRNDTRHQEYYDNAAASMDASKEPVAIADVAVPEWLLWGLVFPYNLTSRQLPLTSDNGYYPEAVNDSLYVPDDTGKLYPASVSTVRSLLPPDQLTGCPRPSKYGRVELPLDGPVIGFGWWVRMEYAADGPTNATITAGTKTHTIDLNQGIHNLFFTAEGDFDTITVSDLDTDVKVCVTSVQLGQLTPFGGRGL